MGKFPRQIIVRSTLKQVEVYRLAADEALHALRKLGDGGRGKERTRRVQLSEKDRKLIGELQQLLRDLKATVAKHPTVLPQSAQRLTQAIARSKSPASEANTRATEDSRKSKSGGIGTGAPSGCARYGSKISIEGKLT